jgi:hypothetical protein
MIIRHKHKGQFVIVPNGIFHDPRLSLAAKGLLAYLLSLPPAWEVRHDHLQRKLRIGRKLMDRAFKELVAAGYATRDESQGRDEHNRFTTLNYVVSDISNCVPSDVPSPMCTAPPRKRSTGNNNKEKIKTDFTNTFPKSLPVTQGGSEQAQQRQYSEVGRRAIAAGQSAVFVGSKPYEAWRLFRGEDGMPGFIDKAIINGRPQNIVWMPSLNPPNYTASNEENSGG